MRTCIASWSLVASLLLFMLPLASAAEQAIEPFPRRSYNTERTLEKPVIDGRLGDSAWDLVSWSGDFIQREPAEGAPPSQSTEFKVVYDDDALYLAFRIHDDPETMARLLARRDEFPGDWIEVNIDSYLDLRTAFSFTLSLSGVQGDEFVSKDGQDWNANWNPIWQGATQANERGWTAEMQIPLSQLRFDEARDQVWGIQVQRRQFHLEERTEWQRIPKDISGWVRHFGRLRGLEDLSPQRRIELAPYVVAGGEQFEAEIGDPFRTGDDNIQEFGLDGKIGLTNNLTLDFTLNPDFGQVEADPSEINLTAFETFFEERRPFFVEGNDILDLSVSPARAGGPFTQDRLFYSRRLGRSPAFRPTAGNGRFVDAPENTTILGAFKLSGKTAGGLSIGLLESVTAEETARIGNGSEEIRQTVEPLTNFFVARLQKDFDEGNTQIGGMFTAVNRKIDDEHLDFLTREAYAGGFDFSTFFKDRNYQLEATLLGSELRGSEASILAAQTSSARYFQRPDHRHARLDPTRTSLSGHAGSLRFSRTNSDLMYQAGVTWRSPGFEINDLGFMRSADGIHQFAWLGYRKRNPFSIFDNWSLNFNQRVEWDYGGTFLQATYNVNNHAQFRNKYAAGFSITRYSETTSNSRLRGGPASLWPGSWEYEFWSNTDPRKKLSFDLGGNVLDGDEDSESYGEAYFVLNYRPTNAIRLSINPSFWRAETEVQYIDTLDFDGADRFVHGLLDHETLSITLRLDYAISPNLTVQLYAAPFLSNGRYSELKRIADPQADEYRDRFRTFSDAQLVFDRAANLFLVDENLDGMPDYNFSNPDFDAREFNSNLVIRWEYSPGSTAFLVWSQVRENPTVLGRELSLDQDLDDLFSVPPHDVILIKVSKWFSL